MLSSAIVVFREVFEIVLIVGIILAATKDMPGRMRPILLGVFGGVLGAVMIAVFTDKISSLAQGVGQEYFNAGVLFTAAAFIGWTVLWMKKNARHMKKHFTDVGNAVTSGKAPLMALATIIALAILREGAEIVLFTYGMLASGQSPLSIGIGGAMGMIGGVVVGTMLYLGLINLSLKVFFQVTSALLVLLVAGMMSQAFGFLVSAGAFEGLSQTVWDSSFLLNDDGLIGKSLGTLVGYTSHPTAIQLIAYLLTLAFMVFTMDRVTKQPSQRAAA